MVIEKLETVNLDRMDLIGLGEYVRKLSLQVAEVVEAVNTLTEKLEFLEGAEKRLSSQVEGLYEDVYKPTQVEPDNAMDRNTMLDKMHIKPAFDWSKPLRHHSEKDATERWVPEEGEEYWYWHIFDEGELPRLMCGDFGLKSMVDDGDSQERLEQGNCFKTRQEAAEKIRKLLS